MTENRIFGKTISGIAVGIFLAAICSQAWAVGAPKKKPLELRKIMQELGKDMQVIPDGISREDWVLVAKTAPKIAEHPQPPIGERMRILSFVGAEAGKFKVLDEQTHQDALALEQAANCNDGKTVIATFGILQNACLACHQEFRNQFVENFYGQR